MFKAATVENQGYPLAIDHYGSVALGRTLNFYDLAGLPDVADLQLGSGWRRGRALRRTAKRRRLIPALVPSRAAHEQPPGQSNQQQGCSHIEKRRSSHSPQLQSQPGQIGHKYACARLSGHTSPSTIQPHGKRNQSLAQVTRVMPPLSSLSRYILQGRSAGVSPAVRRASRPPFCAAGDLDLPYFRLQNSPVSPTLAKTS